MPITFNNQNVNFKLKNKLQIKSWITKIIKTEGKKLGEINYLFTSDEELLKINIQYLKHNTYTDIITFDYSEEKKLNGDIIISIDRVKENAKKFDVTFDKELKRVMIHGVLHLCGYSDKTKLQKEIIRKKENQALNKYK